MESLGGGFVEYDRLADGGVRGGSRYNGKGGKGSRLWIEQSRYGMAKHRLAREKPRKRREEGLGKNRESTGTQLGPVTSGRTNKRADAKGGSG